MQALKDKACLEKDAQHCDIPHVFFITSILSTISVKPIHFLIGISLTLTQTRVAFTRLSI